MKTLKSPTTTGTHNNTVIPDVYNKKTIRVLLCNPSVLYIYWDLPLEHRDPNNQLSLRIATINQESTDTVEIDSIVLKKECFSHYYTLPLLKAHYIIELRKILDNGSFRILCSTAHAALFHEPQQQQNPLPELPKQSNQPSVDTLIKSVTITADNQNSLTPEPEPPVKQTISNVMNFTTPSSWIHSSS